jgi:predicted Zn finger-like uncharacterized protein
MPVATQCPSCKRKFKLADRLLGKTVRCPNCQETFKVKEEAKKEFEAPLPETAVTNEPARRQPTRQAEDEEDRPRRRRRYDEDEENDEKRAEDEDEETSPRRRRRYEEEQGDRYEDSRYEDEDDDRVRRRKRRRQRNRAAKVAAMGPAIGLMSVGGLVVLIGLVSLVLNLLGAALVAPHAAGGPGQADWIIDATSGVLGAIFGICWGGVLVSGGLSFLTLKSYGYAMTACIVSMVPCTLCCILSMPFGIWGLVVLCRDDVKDAFR